MDHEQKILLITIISTLYSTLGAIAFMAEYSERYWSTAQKIVGFVLAGPLLWVLVLINYLILTPFAWFWDKIGKKEDY